MIVGDKVSFWYGEGAVEHECTVTHVWSDVMVNLLTPGGETHTSVPLRQDGMAGYYFTPKLSAPTLTFGQKAVGLTFNPSNNPLVDAIKRQYADVIDMLDNARSLTPNPEIKRMLSVAITETQTAQMWAVKAVTWSH